MAAAQGDPANSRRYMAPTSVIVPLSGGNTYRAADAVQNPLTPRSARLFHQCDSKKEIGFFGAKMTTGIVPPA